MLTEESQKRVGVSLHVAALMLSGLWWTVFLLFGPPLPIDHDELNFLYDSLKLVSQGQQSGYAHGPLLYELIAVLEVFLYAVLHLGGVVSSPQEFLLHVVRQQAAHLAMARALCAIAAVVLVHLGF